MSPKRKKVSQFIIMGETQIRVGGFELLWLWIAIEPKTQVVLRIKMSKERNTFVGEPFQLDMVYEYAKKSNINGWRWYIVSVGMHACS